MSTTSKVHLCKQDKDGKVCGETNPEMFSKGRYTNCIKCRNTYHKKYHKKVVAYKEIEMNMTIIERINENRGDLGKNIHDMIIDIFQTHPLEDMGIAVPMKIKELEDNILSFKNDILNILLGMDRKVDKLFNENEKLKEEKDKLKKDNEDLKTKLDDLNRNYLKNLLKYDKSH